MSQSSVELFSQNVADLKKKGLKDIKFYPGIVSEALPEGFCEEANRLINAVQNNEGKKLSFGDSKKG